MPYSGSSIVDYLASTGQKTDFASRASLAQSKGITGYTGTAQQNTQLLNILRSGQTTQPVNTQQTVQQTTQPGTQTATTNQPGMVGGQPTSVQDLINMGYTGYQGWDSAGALADYKATGGSGKGGPMSSGGATGLGGSAISFNSPTINLPEIYQSLYDNSGVSSLESELSSKTKAFNNAQAIINDNPYLSEANRVGRLEKLQKKFNDDSAGLRSDIATKKADIETKLNIQAKQFDINSTQAQVAFNKFKDLLSSGALDNATGEDIASITRATGISSSLIQSAIKAQKAKNVNTDVIQYDDGTNTGFVVINKDTGDIIKKEAIAVSKPKAVTENDKSANLQSQFISALEAKKNSYGHVSPQDWQGAIASWISRGGSRQDFIMNFKQYADPNRGDFVQAYGFDPDQFK